MQGHDLPPAISYKAWLGHEQGLASNYKAMLSMGNAEVGLFHLCGIESELVGHHTL